MKKGTFTKVLVFVGVIILVCMPLAEDGAAYADSLSGGDGFVYPATYSVGKGGSVTMYIHASEDLVISGVDTALFTTGITVTGFAAGKYPDDEINGIAVTEGHISLERIKIVPEEGYSIDNVMIKEGEEGIWISKDNISSYDFSDDVNAFIVIFRLMASSQTPSSQPGSSDTGSRSGSITALSADPSSAQDPAESSLSDAQTSKDASGSETPGGSREYPELLIWLITGLSALFLMLSAIIFVLKHRKIRGRLRK
ncbi:MAG: hypothetical protein ACYC5K_01485 [Saccharofermentanales bacterium]